jgi:hypothetical protein
VLGAEETHRAEREMKAGFHGDLAAGGHLSEDGAGAGDR